MTVVEAKGVNGTVVFDGAFVTIKRSGFVAASTQGRSEKRIPLSQISAVQFKPASAMFNGYISFTIAGATEKHSKLGSQNRDAAHDENSVVFRSKHLTEMTVARDAIDAAIAARNQPVAAAPASGAAEVERLAQLHAQGVLSDEEFRAAKARALGL